MLHTRSQLRRFFRCYKPFIAEYACVFFVIRMGTFELDAPLMDLFYERQFAKLLFYWCRLAHCFILTIRDERVCILMSAFATRPYNAKLQTWNSLIYILICVFWCVFFQYSKTIPNYCRLIELWSEKHVKLFDSFKNFSSCGFWMKLKSNEITTKTTTNDGMHMKTHF